MYTLDMRKVITQPSLFRGFRNTIALCKDRSGVALYEYAVILAFFSISACVLLASLDTSVNTTLQNHASAMETYNENPN